MSLRQVLIIYYLIFVLCISLAISYALIMLFEVIFVFYSLSGRFNPKPIFNLNIPFSFQAPLVHLEKLVYYFLGVGKLPNVKMTKTE